MRRRPLPPANAAAPEGEGGPASGVDKGILLEPGEPDEPLHDDALRKALAQAPDRAALPDWRVRQAILDHAHDAISASEELLAASREQAPWWRLAWWREKVGLAGATPWNAALAALMVAVLVTLIWQREPAPGARADDAPLMPAAPAPPAPAVKEEVVKEGALAPTAVPPSPAPAAPVTARQESKPVLPPAPPPPAPTPVAPAPTATGRDPTAGADSAIRPSTESLATAPSASEASAGRRKPAPAPAPAPTPSTASEASRAAAGDAARPAPAAAAAPGARSDAVPLPDFASLSRWTELRVANVNGAVRVVPRAEAGELGLLMSSAAIMAVGAPPLRSLPEWRVSLERRGQVLAVLEVARKNVRWSEGALPPTTGTPPPEALEALRDALQQAVGSGGPARAAPAPPPAKAPDAGASSGRLPYAPLAPPAPPDADAPRVPQ